jgi:hypothetical protein
MCTYILSYIRAIVVITQWLNVWHARERKLLLWTRFINENINRMIRIRFDEYLNNNGLNVVAFFARNGWSEGCNSYGVTGDLILYNDKQDIPNTLRRLKGMEEMHSLSSLTAGQLKFQKTSHAVSTLTAWHQIHVRENRYFYSFRLWGVNKDTLNLSLPALASWLVS